MAGVTLTNSWWSASNARATQEIRALERTVQQLIQERDALRLDNSGL
jgi:hypothetical protein